MRKPKMYEWVRFPSTKIENHWLREFRWRGPEGICGSDAIATLMVLIALAHRVDPDTHSISATYDQLGQATHLSRTKISAGLSILVKEGVISRGEERSQFKMLNIAKDGEWAKLPAKGLYRNESIEAFRHFTLRNMAELNALKLYVLFAVRRSREFNHAHLTYDKIEIYSGIDRTRVKQALGVLLINGLIQVEQIRAIGNEFGFSNAYRLCHLDPYSHQGNNGVFDHTQRTSEHL